MVSTSSKYSAFKPLVSNINLHPCTAVAVYHAHRDWTWEGAKGRGKLPINHVDNVRSLMLDLVEHVVRRMRCRLLNNTSG